MVHSSEPYLVCHFLFTFLTEAAPSKPRTFLERVQEWFVSQVYEIVADFTEEAQPEPVEDVEGDPLTVKK